MVNPGEKTFLPPTVPSIEALERPAPLKEVLKKDVEDDCFPCRIMGAGTFVGLGAYSYFSGHNQLRAQKAKILKSNSFIGFRGRQAGITGTALALVGMGWWRLIN